MAESAVFPRFGRPRVLIGAGDRPSRALALYQPSAPAARLAHLAARLPGPRGVVLRRARAGDGEGRIPAAAAEVIRSRLAEPSAAVSYFIGNDDRREKAIAQVAVDARVIAYVKMGRGAAAAALANEGRALARLAARSNLPASLPQVIGETSAQGWRYLFLAPPETRVRPRSRRRPPSPADEAFLAALFATTAAESTIERIDAARGIAATVARLARRPETRLAAATLGRGWRQASAFFAGRAVRVGFGHGDYAPWNAFEKADGGLFVFDWEHADAAAPALADLLHYLLASEVLVRRRSAVVAVADLLAPEGRGRDLLDRHAAQSGVAPADVEGYLLLYLLGRALRALDEGSAAAPWLAAIDGLVARLDPTPSRRVLLSAYACEPDVGSEPAVGWHWAIGRARRGDETWVITRANNRAAIAAADAPEVDEAVSFLFYDPPAWARRLKRGRRGLRLFYLLWQWGAASRALEMHRLAGFAAVHHVTFAGIRQPSFMGRLGIPFDFGPAGGGEHAPWRLRVGLGPRAFVAEAVRDLANALVRWDPLMRHTFARAGRILVTSEETEALVPARWRHKVRRHLAIAWPAESLPAPPAPRPAGAPLRLLFAGRLVAWKGLHLALRALARARLDESTLTVAGEGPERRRLERLARRLGLAGRVHWRGALPRRELLELYRAHHAFVFPSLHDSGGLVVLEALAAGLPVLCLDRGGPGAMVAASCGRVVAAAGRSEDEVVADLAAGLAELADETLRGRLAAGAQARARALSWERLIAEALEEPARLTEA